MSTLDIAKDLLGSIPLTEIHKEKAELLKTQIATMEGRLKLMEDQVRWAEKKLADCEKENTLLKVENASLQNMVAESALSEDFEQKGPFVYKRGDDNPRCPTCKMVLSIRGGHYECKKCGWFYEEGGQAEFVMSDPSPPRW